MARHETGEDPAARPEHAIGEPLDPVSVDELRDRIDVLRAEIVRIEAEISRKQASRSAADAMFKR